MPRLVEGLLVSDFSKSIGYDMGPHVCLFCIGFAGGLAASAKSCYGVLTPGDPGGPVENRLAWRRETPSNFVRAWCPGTA